MKTVSHRTADSNSICFKKRNMKILQANVDRGLEAIDLIYKFAKEEMSDIIIMADQIYKK